MNNNNFIRTKKFIFYYLILIITSFLFIRSFKEIHTKNIKISGTKLISKDVIIKNSSLLLPQKLILIKTKLHERELSENLSLKNISIKRQLVPFGLIILFKTRVPVAYAEINNNEEIIRGFVDEEGFFINKEFAIIPKEFTSKLRIIGWRKTSRETISKIVKAYKGNRDLKVINISKDGFLVLEEEKFKKIFLGNQPEKIDLQLKLILEIKKQLKDKDFFERIEDLDLTDINNPILKVFKP